MSCRLVVNKMTACVIKGGCGVEDQVSFWLDATANDCSSRKQPLLHSNIDTHPFYPQWGFLSTIHIRCYSCAPNLETALVDQPLDQIVHLKTLWIGWSSTSWIFNLKTFEEMTKIQERYRLWINWQWALFQGHLTGLHRQNVFSDVESSIQAFSMASPWSR
jgi:hypothetical protein